MKIIKMLCETTKEGTKYLAFNGYKPILRFTKKLWLVGKIGNPLDDVTVLSK